jgi:hypothetical protein
MNRLLRRIGLTVSCGGMLMFSDRLGAGAAAPETLHLDVFVGEADSWDVTSTLIYGKSEAILLDCQFRISQVKEPADQILNAREAGETGRRIADPRRPAGHDSASERNVVRQWFCALAGRGTQTKIWKSRVTNSEERLIATMSGTLFALFEKEDRHGNS